MPSHNLPSTAFVANPLVTSLALAYLACRSGESCRYEAGEPELATAACTRTGIQLSGTFDGTDELDVLQTATDPRWGALRDPAPDDACRDDDLISSSTRLARLADPRER